MRYLLSFCNQYIYWREEIWSMWRQCFWRTTFDDALYFTRKEKNKKRLRHLHKTITFRKHDKVYNLAQYYLEGSKKKSTNQDLQHVVELPKQRRPSSCWREQPWSRCCPTQKTLPWNGPSRPFLLGVGILLCRHDPRTTSTSRTYFGSRRNRRNSGTRIYWT